MDFVSPKRFDNVVDDSLIDGIGDLDDDDRMIIYDTEANAKAMTSERPMRKRKYRTAAGYRVDLS
jgi:hypothetical protein